MNKEAAVTNILTRPNSINGRYAKASFGLTTWEMTNFTGSAGQLIRKADLVDEMIRRELSRGKNVDDEEVLQTIAMAIDSTSVPEKTALGGVVTIAVVVGIMFFLINLLS